MTTPIVNPYVGIKGSQITTASALNGSETVTVVQSGNSRKFALSTLLKDTVLTGLPTANNILFGYATMDAAGGTTVLTVASEYMQFFTGTLAQTVKMPVTSTLQLSQSWMIVNNSSASITVQSSGSNTIVTLPAGTATLITCIAITGTTKASWSVSNAGTAVNQSGGTVSATDMAYSGTFTGGTDVVNIGSNQFYKDAAGNVGIGVVPNAWGSGLQAIQSKYYSLWNHASNNVAQFSNNVWVDSGGVYRYVANGQASLIQLYNGGFSLSSAETGNANDAVSLNLAFYIDSAKCVYIPKAPFWQYAPAPTSKSTTATLTAAELKTGIINTTGTSYTVTLPTGTDLDTAFPGVPSADIALKFTVINTASGTVTIAVGVSGMTSLGTLTVATATSANFSLRRTAANTYVLYRV